MTDIKRKIQDIALLLAENFVDLETRSETIDKYLKLLADNSERLGPYYRYLGLLHDSWILKTSIADNKFTLILNDFTTHIFADALIDKKGLNIDHHKLIFPIKIDFAINDITFNTVNSKGLIKRIEPTAVDEYLYEEIISVDKNTIDLGLIVWKDFQNKPGQRILILIRANDIILTEQQDSAWLEIFGNIYDDYYKYFRSQLETKRYLSDQHICNILVDEFDNTNFKHS
jgi:hypothetical protein